MMLRASLLLIGFAACSASAPAAQQQASTAQASGAQPASGMNASCEHHGNTTGEAAPTATAAGTLYGAPLALTETTSLQTLMASPDQFADRNVKTEGVVARVCQRMGCWMELRAENEERVVRVPMAGHAFFLPRDAAGKHAVVEGRVVMQALSPEQRAHLESEGATATGSTFSIHATSVELR